MIPKLKRLPFEC